MPKTPVKTSTSPVTVPSTVPSSSPSSVAATGEQEIKLDKIKITPYSDSKDWESTVFELKLVLQQVWRDTSLDIIRYLTETKYALSEMIHGLLRAHRQFQQCAHGHLLCSYIWMAPGQP